MRINSLLTNKNTMKKIAMVLSTNGIEYDDRIRKEMLTIMKLYPDVKFHIFAIIDNKHELEGEFVSDYGVEYTVPLLKSRVRYKPGTHELQKGWEFFKMINPKLKGYDAIWCADMHPLFFLALSGKRKIWDLHETPESFLGNPIKRAILKYLMMRCRGVVHANEARLSYMKETDGISNVENQFVIRNYPNFNDVDTKTDDLYANFIKWKGETDCVYLQGAVAYDRCPTESIHAIMSIKGLKAVVVGRFNEQIKAQLLSEYGEELNERLFFTGLVRQKMTPLYIRECKVSLVLYRNTNINNYYCEPNRMYQSIINNCPVVVGNNPPMKGLVEKYGFGVVLSDDGSNEAGIADGLKIVLKDYDEFLVNIKRYSHRILWDSQEEEFKKIIDVLFS